MPLGDGPARKPNSDETTTLYRVTQQELQGEQTRIPIPTRQERRQAVTLISRSIPRRLARVGPLGWLERKHRPLAIVGQFEENLSIQVIPIGSEFGTPFA